MDWWTRELEMVGQVNGMTEWMDYLKDVRTWVTIENWVDECKEEGIEEQMDGWMKD